MKIVWQNLVVILSLLAYYFCLASVDVQTIGAFFNDKDSQAQIPLESLIYQRNQLDSSIKYDTVHKYVSDSDSFMSSKALCDFLENNPVAAVFGPPSPSTSATLESICSFFEVPYIVTSWRPSKEMPNNVISFFPEAESYAKGLAKVVESLDWNEFVIIYENEDGLIRMQEMLKLHEFSKDSRLNKIILHKLGEPPDFRPLLKRIKDSGFTNVIIDCELTSVKTILDQATEVELLNIQHKFFLTNSDAHTLDFSGYSPSNITTIRLFDPSSKRFNKAVENWNQYCISRGIDTTIDFNSVLTSSVLMHDAVLLFTETIRTLSVNDRVFSHELFCNATIKSTNGFRISSFMKIEEKPKRFLTGPIKFEEDMNSNTVGNRIEFTLYVVEVMSDQVIANWTASEPDKIILTRSENESLLASVVSLQKLSKVIVSTRVGKPYYYMRGNDTTAVGYSIDLIKAISKILGFDYEFVVTKDNAYANIVNDLLQGRAHLGICDLTITHERRQKVDFSMPFMTLGISILYQKGSQKDVDMFAFLDPFSIHVWIYTATLYLIVSIILFFIARMAPDDWENPHLCDENPEELENIWDLKNCFWLTLGSIMTQGCDILPKGISSRMATSMWWFFSLIMTSSYTANLAAFLTMQRMELTIDGAEALSKQNKIKYGAVEGGATRVFFRDSNYSVYQRMWINMEASKPSVYEKNNDDGVERVRQAKNGLYAFLMESTQIEYEVETKCDLKQIGGWLDTKGYGIAMPLNCLYRSAINKAVLQLQEDGTLHNLKEQWWKKERDEPSCGDSSGDEGSSSNELALANVGGVFLVLGIGVALAFVLAILEFLWNVRNISVEEHLTFWEALKVEVKFACNVWITKKRTKPVLSESSSSSSKSRSRTRTRTRTRTRSRSRSRSRSRPRQSTNRSAARSLVQNAGSFLNINNISRRFDQ